MARPIEVGLGRLVEPEIRESVPAGDRRDRGAESVVPADRPRVFLYVSLAAWSLTMIGLVRHLATFRPLLQTRG